MILMIDNFDSFTYNLVQAIQAMGEDVVVRRNNALTIPEINRMNPSGILISPGPGRPDSAGISLDVIREYNEKIPIFGVCLGHQCIVEAFGGNISHAMRVMHGKYSRISHDGEGIFSGIPQLFSAVRYHSLAMDSQVMPEGLVVCATADDGEVMGVRHQHLHVYGVQFHPESIATEYGCELIHSFIQRTKEVV
ncbi:MAG: aminodeoxychorismate/anthranilate synthase component II [Deltaproteobacteria bacterium]|nr:aminodeoxychorismate/anthranilate synthase component II [Deltaproteobacteria bacterium]